MYENANIGQHLETADYFVHLGHGVGKENVSV